MDKSERLKWIWEYDKEFIKESTYGLLQIILCLPLLFIVFAPIWLSMITMFFFGLGLGKLIALF